MFTLHGTAKKDGVAIALAATVNAAAGVNAVSPSLLAAGLEALRRRLEPRDYPEAVIACDNLAMGVSVRIPGITTIGIAAESEADLPGLPVEVPCVIGLPKLLESISDEDILIVDGNKGVVYVDPDPQTLVHYQQAGMQRETVFITSEHIPARTQDGETVLVYAHAVSVAEVELAMEQGADGLIVDLRAAQTEAGGFYEAVLKAAPGKPVAFVLDLVPEEMLRAAARFAAPGQVTALFPPADIEARASEMAAALERIFSGEDEDAPELGLGSIDSGRARPAGHALDELAIIGEAIDALVQLVRAGARGVAVAPGMVADAKYTIRSIGAEEEL